MSLPPWLQRAGIAGMHHNTSWNFHLMFSFFALEPGPCACLTGTLPVSYTVAIPSFKFTFHRNKTFFLVDF